LHELEATKDAQFEYLSVHCSCIGIGCGCGCGCILQHLQDLGHKLLTDMPFTNPEQRLLSA
jgi:hypothetical protein